MTSVVGMEISANQISPLEKLTNQKIAGTKSLSSRNIFLDDQNPVGDVITTDHHNITK